MTTLSYERIFCAKPRHWIFFLHGFLGSGSNWRTFARRLVEKRPDFGAVLIDLRMHGKSQDCAPPYTLAAAALDLVKLSHEFVEPVHAVLGHSFGAKVALSFVELFHHNLKTAWLVDSVPWALENNNKLVSKILALLEPLAHKIFPSRQDFVAQLESAALDKATAQWLAMNLRSSPEGLKLELKIPALKLLLDDYFSQDLIYILSQKNIATHIFFALGENSALLSTSDRQRILEITNQHRATMNTHIIKNAGHYVHNDSPDELLELVLRSLPTWE
jgi:pimeloyl-ACP methyl ester carboxylesterase